MVPIVEPISNPELLLDLKQISEPVLVPKTLTFEPKSTILSNHIQLLDKDIQQDDSEMIFLNWMFEGGKCQNRILHGHIQLWGYKGTKVKGEFLRTPDSLHYATTSTPIRLPPELPLWGDISLYFSCPHIHDVLWTMHEIGVGEGFDQLRIFLGFSHSFI